MSQQACATLAHARKNATTVAQMDIEQTLVHDQSEYSRKRRQRKKKSSRNPRLLVSEVTEESEKKSVSKTVAATVREILGEPNVSVKTLTITHGILGMTHAEKQECDDGMMGRDRQTLEQPMNRWA